MNPVKHVAIIMDGNGRWGVKHKQSRNKGHRAGLNNVDLIINQCIHHKIEILTLYTFSSENWKRPKNEITFLFRLLENFLIKKIQNLLKNKIKLKIIGNKKRFSNKMRKLLIVSEKKTSRCNGLQINLALNYGSKEEILNAAKLISKDKKKFTEKNFEKNLYTHKMPNPDLLIRTGNTKRLSNFLLWQLAYTEIFFVKKLWPEFMKKDYIKILNSFRLLKRNFGAI